MLADQRMSSLLSLVAAGTSFPVVGCVVITHQVVTSLLGLITAGTFGPVIVLVVLANQVVVYCFRLKLITASTGIPVLVMIPGLLKIMFNGTNTLATLTLSPVHVLVVLVLVVSMSTNILLGTTFTGVPVLVGTNHPLVIKDMLGFVILGTTFTGVPVSIGTLSQHSAKLMRALIDLVAAGFAFAPVLISIMLPVPHGMHINLIGFAAGQADMPVTILSARPCLSVVVRCLDNEDLVHRCMTNRARITTSHQTILGTGRRNTIFKLLEVMGAGVNRLRLKPGCTTFTFMTVHSASLASAFLDLLARGIKGVVLHILLLSTDQTLIPVLTVVGIALSKPVIIAQFFAEVMLHIASLVTTLTGCGSGTVRGGKLMGRRIRQTTGTGLPVLAVILLPITHVELVLHMRGLIAAHTHLPVVIAFALPFGVGMGSYVLLLTAQTLIPVIVFVLQFLTEVMGRRIGSTTITGLPVFLGIGLPGLAFEGVSDLGSLLTAFTDRPVEIIRMVPLSILVVILVHLHLTDRALIPVVFFIRIPLFIRSVGRSGIRGTAFALIPVLRLVVLQNVVSMVQLSAGVYDILLMAAVRAQAHENPVAVGSTGRLNVHEIHAIRFVNQAVFIGVEIVAQRRRDNRLVTGLVHTAFNSTQNCVFASRSCLVRRMGNVLLINQYGITYSTDLALHTGCLFDIGLMVDGQGTGFNLTAYRLTVRILTGTGLGQRSITLGFTLRLPTSFIVLSPAVTVSRDLLHIHLVFRISCVTTVHTQLTLQARRLTLYSNDYSVFTGVAMCQLFRNVSSVGNATSTGHRRVAASQTGGLSNNSRVLMTLSRHLVTRLGIATLITSVRRIAILIASRRRHNRTITTVVMRRINKVHLLRRITGCTLIHVVALRTDAILGTDRGNRFNILRVVVRAGGRNHSLIAIAALSTLFTSSQAGSDTGRRRFINMLHFVVNDRKHHIPLIVAPLTLVSISTSCGTGSRNSVNHRTVMVNDRSGFTVLKYCTTAITLKTALGTSTLAGSLHILHDHLVMAQCSSDHRSLTVFTDTAFHRTNLCRGTGRCLTRHMGHAICRSNDALTNRTNLVGHTGSRRTRNAEIIALSNDHTFTQCADLISNTGRCVARYAVFIACINYFVLGGSTSIALTIHEATFVILRTRSQASSLHFGFLNQFPSMLCQFAILMLFLSLANITSIHVLCLLDTGGRCSLRTLNPGMGNSFTLGIGAAFIGTMLGLLTSGIHHGVRAFDGGDLIFLRGATSNTSVRHLAGLAGSSLRDNALVIVVVPGDVIVGSRAQHPHCGLGIVLVAGVQRAGISSLGVGAIAVLQPGGSDGNINRD